MGNREAEMNEFQKLSDHHDAVAKAWRRESRSNTGLAKAFEKTNPVAANHFMDMAKTCDVHAGHHEVERDRMMEKREKLNNGSGADVVDSHESAGDSLMHSAAASLLDADGRFDFRKLIAAEF